MDKDTKQFILSPWHVYTCVFIGFWACSAFFNSFLVTTGLCILFGLISDSLNKYMIGGNEIEVQDECVKKQPSVNQFSEENVITQGTTRWYLLDDAPTKPLPPEPEGAEEDSDTEEENTGEKIQQCEVEDKHKGFVPHLIKVDGNLGAEILEPLDEYDRHPIPEYVEFVDPNGRLRESEIMCKDDDPVMQPLEQEERSNDGDNTSPSQDSFQMLDMGSDSEVSRPVQDDFFAESKVAINSSNIGGIEEILNLSRDTSVFIDEIPQISAKSLVQFTDNSNVDSHRAEGTVLVNLSDNEKLRQTSKVFVDDLVEDALNITSEQHIQSQDAAEHVMKYNRALLLDIDQTEGRQLESVDSEKAKVSSAFADNSPRDLMAELLGSVPPPSTSPPEIIFDAELKSLEGTNILPGGDLGVLGNFTTDDKEAEEKELEKLLRDAQKDECGRSNGHAAKETGIINDDAKDLGEMLHEKDTKHDQDIRRHSSSDYDEESPKITQFNPYIRKDSSSDYDEEGQDGAEEENDDVGELVAEEKTKRNKLRKRDSSSDYDEGNDNDNVEDDDISDSDLEMEVNIKTKTLADLDEGDPWATKCLGKDNDNILCSEDSEKPNAAEVLRHLDSDDLPAQDDMSHRAVFGDDDDRNDDDVLLEEDEEEAKEREKENRKLSTTVPSLMEENAALDMQHKADDSTDVSRHAEGDKHKVRPGASTVLSSDSSYVQEIETALEAKEVPVISVNIPSDDKGLQLQADILGETLSSTAISVSSSEVKVDVAGDSISTSTKIIDSDKPLLEF